MVPLSDDEFEAANARGRAEFLDRPHARTARFDRTSGLMTLELYNGCSFTFPPRQLQGMELATDEQLEAVDLGALGYGLHWDALDADFTVPGLLEGQFGTQRFMEGFRARLGVLYDQKVRDLPDTGWDAQAAE